MLTSFWFPARMISYNENKYQRNSSSVCFVVSFHGGGGPTRGQDPPTHTRGRNLNLSKHERKFVGLPTRPTTFGCGCGCGCEFSSYLLCVFSSDLTASQLMNACLVKRTSNKPWWPLAVFQRLLVVALLVSFGPLAIFQQLVS